MGSDQDQQPNKRLTWYWSFLVFLGALLLVTIRYSLPSDYQFPFLQGSTQSAPSSAFAKSASTVLERLSQNGTKDCHNISTAAVVLDGLPSANGRKVVLSTDVVYKFRMVAFDANESMRCFGGDFYETDLSSPRWKSRPPITDFGNGSYLIELKVDREFAGNYTFTVILLYSNFHGMDHQPFTWALEKEVLQLQILFTPADASKHYPLLPTCTASSFSLTTPWTGKWTRTKFIEPCELDQEGRYRCFKDDEQCGESQCEGYIENLESNGWVYSSLCKFRIWDKEDAWDCLDGKKLFFWGDSNHRDTLQNLLKYVLGVDQDINRRFNQNITNPSNPAQRFNLVSIFNGHEDPKSNFMGLGCLYFQKYRELVKQEFLRGRSPDAVIINSGIHDGWAWDKAEGFASAVKFASAFWKSLLLKSKTARVVIRSTVALAGDKRKDPSNPHKMETFNSILNSEFHKQLQDLDHQLMFVDAYDMTFPWHYDHSCSDGPHYGIKAKLEPWFDRVGHYYFVDLMLVHVLLTAICT